MSKIAADTPRPIRSTWLFGVPLTAFILYLTIDGSIVTGSINAGVSASAMVLWFVFTVTAVYTAATGRRSWMRLRHGRASALSVALLAFAAFVVGGVGIALLAR